MAKNKRRIILRIALCALLLVPSTDAWGSDENTESVITSNTVTSEAIAVPLYFIKNEGQDAQQVRFKMPAKDKTIFFTDEGLTFVLNNGQSAWSFSMKFAGANTVIPEGREEAGVPFTYFRGDKVIHASTTSKITYPNVWDGIDVEFIATENALKYNLIVAAGADPTQARFDIDDAEGSLKDGALIFETPVASITDAAPTATQTINGTVTDVPVNFSVSDEDDGFSFSFALGEYNPRFDLVIDPYALVYASLVGGNGVDEARGSALDSSNNFYIAGTTGSTDFPATGGAYDTGANGADDGFLYKVNATGTALSYATYIGGTLGDAINAVDVDSSGNAYVVGSALSTDFPTTASAYDITQNGASDCFVSKFNSTGTALIYSTYLGGTNGESCTGIDVDSSGAAYLSGGTAAANFPVVASGSSTPASLLTHSGGSDGFVSRLSASGSILEMSFFVGGTGNEDMGDIKLAASGIIVTAGNTASSDIPVSVGPDLTQNGGIDTYVGKYTFNSASPPVVSITWGGFIGGSANDTDANGYRELALDSTNNVLLASSTSSPEASFPDGDGFGAVPGYDQTYSGGGQTDTYFAKVNYTTAALMAASYLGGAGALDDNYTVTAGPNNEIIVGGTTGAADFPVLDGPDSTYNGGNDGYVSMFNSAGTTLLFSTYLGTNGVEDDVVGVRSDEFGDIYVAGLARSDAGFPNGVGIGAITTFDTSFAGGFYDSFAAKLTTANDEMVTITATIDQTLTFSISDGDGLLYFGPLNPSARKWAHGTNTNGSDSDIAGHTLTVGTNASQGLFTTVVGGPFASGANTIDSINCPAGVCAVPSATSSFTGIGSEQFGLRLVQTGSPADPCAPVAAFSDADPDFYAWGANTDARSIISEPDQCDDTTYEAHYVSNISLLTEIGNYTLTATMVTTAQF